MIESRKPSEGSGMKKVLQLIANIFDNESDDGTSDNDTNGIEQDIGDYGGYGE